MSVWYDVHGEGPAIMLTKLVDGTDIDVLERRCGARLRG